MLFMTRYRSVYLMICVDPTEHTTHDRSGQRIDLLPLYAYKILFLHTDTNDDHIPCSSCLDYPDHYLRSG